MDKNKKEQNNSNEHVIENLDFSIIGEVRGEEAIEMLLSFCSSGKTVDHREILKHSIENTNLFSERGDIYKMLDKLKKYSHINPTNK